VKVEPRPSVRLDVDAAVHAADDLAADVEAEAGSADATGHVRVEPVGLVGDYPEEGLALRAGEADVAAA
jgi:hypothetical protein